MCDFEEIFSLMITPRNFIVVSCFISKLFIFTESFNGLLAHFFCLWKTYELCFPCMKETLTEFQLLIGTF